MPIRVTITPRLDVLMRNIRNNISDAVIEGTNDYLTRLADEIVTEAKASAPHDLGTVRSSIAANVLRSEPNSAHIVIDATAPHAIFTERWPRPHWVSAEKHPEVRSWADRHGIPLKGNKYLFVYGPQAAGMRIPQFWFSDAAKRAIERLGGGELIQSIEMSLLAKLPYDKPRRAAAARLGWIKRKARGMPMAMARGMT